MSESDFEKLKQLESMGFDNIKSNIRALDQARGNLEVAIHILSKDDVVSNPDDENSYSELPYAEQNKTLKSMGFIAIEENIKTLDKTNGDLEAAINMLSKTDANSEPSQLISPSKKVEENIPSETLQHYKEMYFVYSMQLEGMGFIHREDNIRALAKAQGDMDEAIKFLGSREECEKDEEEERFKKSLTK